MTAWDEGFVCRELEQVSDDANVHETNFETGTLEPARVVCSWVCSGVCVSKCCRRGVELRGKGVVVKGHDSTANDLDVLSNLLGL